MKNLITITALFFAFTHSGCEKVSNNKPVLADAIDHIFSLPKEESRENSVVTAHYANDELSESQIRELCATSILYQQTLALFDFDFEPFCGMRITTQRAKKDTNTLWMLTQSPERIIWQQAIKDGEQISVELEDAEGFPWPSEVTTFLSDDDTLRLKLIPQIPLPKQKTFRLKVSLKAPNGEIAEQWNHELMVQEGEQIALPWIPKARPQKIAKQGRKNNRRAG